MLISKINKNTLKYCVRNVFKLELRPLDGHYKCNKNNFISKRSFFSFEGLKRVPSYSSSIIIYYTEVICCRFVYTAVNCFCNAYSFTYSNSSSPLICARLLIIILGLPLVCTTKFVKFLAGENRYFDLPPFLWLLLGCICMQTEKPITNTDTGLSGKVVCKYSTEISNISDLRSLFESYLSDHTFLYKCLTHTVFGHFVTKTFVTHGKKGEENVYEYDVDPRLLDHLKRLMGDIPKGDDFNSFFYFYCELLTLFPQFVKFNGFKLVKNSVDSYTTDKVGIHKFRSAPDFYIINYKLLETIGGGQLQDIIIIFLALFKPKFATHLNGVEMQLIKSDINIGDVMIDITNLTLESVISGLLSTEAINNSPFRLEVGGGVDPNLGANVREFSTYARQTGLDPLAELKPVRPVSAFGVSYKINRPPTGYVLYLIGNGGTVPLKPS